jgi:hypothetical protein
MVKWGNAFLEAKSVFTHDLLQNVPAALESELELPGKSSINRGGGMTEGSFF